MRTDRLQREYGVELRWTVFSLHPETPEAGLELAELFAGREEEIEVMQARLRRLAAAEGLPLSERSRTCNSRRAKELGVTAVPTHLCAGRRLVGFSPYEDFVRLIGRG